MMSADSVFLQIEQGAHGGDFGENQRGLPSDKKIAAGNYKKGAVTLFGLSIAIEQPRGTYRTGFSEGKRWTSRMAAHYGYIKGTKGNDGDAVDCFVGFYPQSEFVFIINQSVKGRFDEHKVMLGFPDQESAERAYRQSYDRTWNGLESIVQASVSQLKWWLKNGAKNRAVAAEDLPYEGLEEMNQKVTWDSAANPVGISLDVLLYQIRHSDAGENLLMDAVTMADILEDSDGRIAFDAMVTPFAKVERKMEVLRGVMERAGNTVKPLSVQISDPFKQRGTTNVAAIFELSDGQTISVYFHNPDTTPNKLGPGDELISWKWNINKKDVTVVVAPERGEDLNVREVARRLMLLAEKNSPAFQRANGKRAETMQRLQGLKDEIAGLEKELASAMSELEVAKMEAEDRKAKAEDAKFEIYKDGNGATGKVDSIYQDRAAMQGALDEIDAPAGSYYGKDKRDGEIFYSFRAETLILKASKRLNVEEFDNLMDQVVRWANKEHGQYGSDWIRANAPAHMALSHGIEADWAMKAIEQRWMKGDAGVLPDEKDPSRVWISGDGLRNLCESRGIAVSDVDSEDDVIRATLEKNGMRASLESKFARSWLITEIGENYGKGFEVSAEVLSQGLDSFVEAATQLKPGAVQKAVADANAIYEMAARFAAELTESEKSSLLNGFMPERAADAAKAAGLSPKAVLTKMQDIVEEGQPSAANLDPTSPEGYAKVMADESLQLAYQDVLDSFFGGRIVDVRNALREIGWGGDHGASELTKGNAIAMFSYKTVGAGNNVVGMTVTVYGAGNVSTDFVDDLAKTPAEFAADIDAKVTPAVAPSDEVAVPPPKPDGVLLYSSPSGSKFTLSGIVVSIIRPDGSKGDKATAQSFLNPSELDSGEVKRVKSLGGNPNDFVSVAGFFVSRVAVESVAKALNENAYVGWRMKSDKEREESRRVQMDSKKAEIKQKKMEIAKEKFPEGAIPVEMGFVGTMNDLITAKPIVDGVTLAYSDFVVVGWVDSFYPVAYVMPDVLDAVRARSDKKASDSAAELEKIIGGKTKDELLAELSDLKLKNASYNKIANEGGDGPSPFSARISDIEFAIANISEPEKEPSVTTEKQSDIALYQSVIDGTIGDILSSGLAKQLRAAYKRHAGDAEMDALFERAVNAYQAAMMAATSNL